MTVRPRAGLGRLPTSRAREGNRAMREKGEEVEGAGGGVEGSMGWGAVEGPGAGAGAGPGAGAVGAGAGAGPEAGAAGVGAGAGAGAGAGPEAAGAGAGAEDGRAEGAGGEGAGPGGEEGEGGGGGAPGTGAAGGGDGGEGAEEEGAGGAGVGVVGGGDGEAAEGAGASGRFAATRAGSTVRATMSAVASASERQEAASRVRSPVCPSRMVVRRTFHVLPCPRETLACASTCAVLRGPPASSCWTAART